MYYIGTLAFDPNYLEHHGIKGQKRGVRRYQNEDRTWTDEGKIRYGRKAEPRNPKQLSDRLKKFKYKEYTKLMSPEQYEKNGGGSCHDQCMYLMNKLRKMGLKPKATFVIEYDDNYNCGMTHSCVTYEQNGKTNWIENAWKERSGINEFGSDKDFLKALQNAHKSGEFGNKGSYKHLDIVEFDDRKHSPGETLDEFVSKIYD